MSYMRRKCGEIVIYAVHEFNDNKRLKYKVEPRKDGGDTFGLEGEDLSSLVKSFRERGFGSHSFSIITTIPAPRIRPPYVRDVVEAPLTPEELSNFFTEFRAKTPCIETS